MMGSELEVSRQLMALCFYFQVAHMLCLDKEELVRRSDMVPYIKRCQVRHQVEAEPWDKQQGLVQDRMYFQQYVQQYI